jgi:hypothetical protein
MAFPTSLDTFATKVDGVTDVLATDVNSLQNAVVALQAKVGVSGSAVTTSDDYKIANAGIGVGQVWTSYVQSTVGTGRLTATNYTNSGVKPIQVLVSCSTSGGTATVGGVVVAYASGGSVQPMSFIVPPGAVYRVDSAIWTWVELR